MKMAKFYIPVSGHFWRQFANNRNVHLFEPMKRIPQPVPDPEIPLHYKSVDATPTESPIIINGKPREPDNFQPRWSM